MKHTLIYEQDQSHGNYGVLIAHDLLEHSDIKHWVQPVKCVHESII